MIHQFSTVLFHVTCKDAFSIFLEKGRVPVPFCSVAVGAFRAGCGARATAPLHS